MTFPFKPKSCISLTTESQLKLLLHVLSQILGDIYRGVQRTPSVTYQNYTNVVAVTLELHKIISFPLTKLRYNSSNSMHVTLYPMSSCRQTTYIFIFGEREQEKVS